MEGELGAAAFDAVAQRGRHRRLRPVERMGQRGWLATWRPGPTDIWRQAERAFVEEDQTGAAPIGVLLDPRPVLGDPPVDRGLVALGGAALGTLGTLHAPAEPVVQQRPHVRGVVTHPGQALD